jgi:heparan-alpha-glucosaminide N-acetyltransferase
MVLVDGAGGEWPEIGHAPWNGCNLADFVMPFFLFIVGMAIPLSLKVFNFPFFFLLLSFLIIGL